MTTSWMLRLNFQCNVTNVWPAPLRKTVAKQLLWDQQPKCSHSNRDGAFFPCFICCIHLQVCFVTGLSPGGGFQSLLHICCVTGLCLEEKLTVWKYNLISYIDSITKYEFRLMKSSTPLYIIAVTAVLINVSAGSGRAKLIYTTFRHTFDTLVTAMFHITSVI